MSDRPFTALRFPLTVDGNGGRLARETDYDRYIVQALRGLLLCAPGERIHRPTLGVGLRHRIFGPNSEATASLVQTMAYEGLSNWLGSLIDVETVETHADREVLTVDITYVVRARGERRELSLEMTL